MLPCWQKPLSLREVQQIRFFLFMAIEFDIWEYEGLQESRLRFN